MSGSHHKGLRRKSTSPSRTHTEGTGGSGTGHTNHSSLTEDPSSAQPDQPTVTEDRSSTRTDKLDFSGLDSAMILLNDSVADLDGFLTDLKTTEEPSTGEEQVTEKSPDDFATNKRAVSANFDFDFDFGLEFADSFPDTAVKPSLELHPLIRNGSATAPLFKVGIACQPSATSRTPAETPAHFRETFTGPKALTPGRHPMDSCDASSTSLSSSRAEPTDGSHQTDLVTTEKRREAKD